MKLTERVKKLSGETKDNCGRDQLKLGAVKKTLDQEVKDKMKINDTQILNDFLVELKVAIENLDSSVFGFSAATSKITEDKKEMEKLTREVAKLKVDVGTVLFELHKSMKSFPEIADESIQSAVCATTVKLRAATNGLVAEIKHAISQVFNKEVNLLKHAAFEANKSASAMKKAKEFVGWQFFSVNLIAVAFVTLLVTIYASPRTIVTQSPKDKQYIIYGKALEKAWPKLSEKARHEIRDVSPTQ